MTNKQAEQFLNIFENAKKMNEDYREYIKMLEKNQDERNNKKIRAVFDRTIFRGYELYKDLVNSKYLFEHQLELIQELGLFFSWKISIKSEWLKTKENEQKTVYEIISVARDRDNHPMKHDGKSEYMLYLSSINSSHLMFIEEKIEKIMISRLEEMTDEEKSKLIVLSPDNIIWLENVKTFVRPFYEYLKDKDLGIYNEQFKQFGELLDFDLNPDSIILELKKDSQK